MTDRTEHVGFDELNDLVDGKLGDSRQKLVSEHVEMCQTCMAEHDKLLELARTTRNLPTSMLPEVDLWPELRHQLNSKKDAVLRPSDTGSATQTGKNTSRGSVWRSGPFLAAAAVVLMALSSGVTAVVLRTAGLVPVGRSDSTAHAPENQNRASGLLVTFRQTELEYTRTIEELQIAVNTQRGTLSPETVRTIDRSVAVVDSAISEARAALVADPNSQILVDLLSATYQRKLDLLRRTSELGSRT